MAITTLLVEEVDKIFEPFGTYDVVRSKVDMELKITSVLKKKDCLVKKLKARFVEGTKKSKEDNEEEDEEEREQDQGPLALMQGMGEDAEKVEGVKEEEKAKEVPMKPKPKKRKAQKQPIG